MAILYNKENGIFTLHTNHTTYQMQVDSYGNLLHLYYGKKMLGYADSFLTYADRGFSGNPSEAGNDRTYSYDTLPQEFPYEGSGDFRSPAFLVKYEDASYGCNLIFKGYKILSGKYALEGLPALYAQNEAETLEIHMEDPVTNLEVILLYGVFAEYDIITRAVKVINSGTYRLYLEKIQSACLDFMTGKFDVISFYGRHAMERNYQRNPLYHGSFKIGSRRGCSSHQYNPMMILAEPNTSEDAGMCYAMSLVYSGSFQAEVEVDQFNQTRAILGLQEEKFSYPLKPGDVFYAPEVVLSCSEDGLSKLSQNLHRCFRKHLCRGKYKTEVRPILLNSWEAAYFDFDGEKIYQLAKQAADLGIEMLVLDDGWFGKRDSDNCSLGDWYVNEEKLGESLNSLISRINALGLKFGLWFEPECVNEDSDLYREHPDWAFTLPGRNPVRSRNQLVLDFSRKEIVDEIFQRMCNILDQGNIEYIKWDMNRSLNDVYSNGSEYQGNITYDYVKGVYSLLEQLIQRYPNLLIEGCSGGGGRFDAGMLYYTPQIWCSDNTDAADRVRIQYGTSFGYPVSSVGSHVSAVPNHQTGRNVSMNTRGVVAMAGTFGYELNLNLLSAEEKKEIRGQIQQYHKYAGLIQDGLYYRLTNPFESEIGAWEFLSEDKKEVLVNAVQMDIHGNLPYCYLRLKGLERGTVYQEESTGRKYDADLLMEIGLPIPVKMGDFEAHQYYFKQM